MRNAAAIWFDRLLLAGSQALRRNEDGEFSYEPPGSRRSSRPWNWRTRS
jgi:hypothetical protein